MKRSAYWIVGLLTALLVGVIGAGTAQAKLAVRSFAIPLSGAQETANVHGNADRGSAVVTVDSITGKVCAKFGSLTLTGGEVLPHVAHIHRAPAGVNGPIVINLFGTGDSVPAPTSYPTGNLCAVHNGSSDLQVLDEIVRRPKDFYVNLHNSTHPGGVVRGQLKPLKESIKDLINASTTPN